MNKRKSQIAAKRPIKGTVSLKHVVKFGPAMMALNDRQRAFVISHNNSGGLNATQSAREAGYGNNRGSQMVTASRLLHDPRIQAAIREDMVTRLNGDLAEVWGHISEIGRNPQHKDQLKALTTMAHHAGMVEITKAHVEHSHTVTFEQRIERIKRLAASTGTDIRTLGLPQQVIEAEFSDVTPTKEPELW